MSRSRDSIALGTPDSEQGKTSRHMRLRRVVSLLLFLHMWFALKKPDERRNSGEEELSKDQRPESSTEILWEDA